MATASMPGTGRPAEITRRLVRASLMAAIVLALSADVIQFEASKECRGGFSAGFGSGFDVHRCDLVVRRIGGDTGV